MKETNSHKEPKYSAVRACLMALIRPVTAVRRADHLPLWKAWMVHVVGAGLTAAVQMVLKLDYNYFVYTAMGWWMYVDDDCDEVISDGVMIWKAMATKTFFIEVSVLFFAAVVMSWCARDEKIRISYTRALRRLFLLTPHVATVFALTGLGLFWLDQSSWWANIEWYSYGEMTRFLAFFVACLWSLWVLLAALGYISTPAVCRWPARCKDCGYQLTGLTTNKDCKNCPECGLAIVRSLGERVRPGITPPGGIGRWLRQTYQAIRHPTALGKNLNTLPPDTSHRRYLAVTIVLLILTSPIAMDLMHRSKLLANKDTYGNWLADWKNIGRDFYVATVGGISIGLPLVATVVVAALGGATLIGLIVGWRPGRNLMPAAIRAACYQSGFALFWAVIFWLGLEVFVVGRELGLLDSLVFPHDSYVCHLIYIPYNIYVHQLIGRGRLGAAVLGIIIYLILIYRATKAARYANG